MMNKIPDQRHRKKQKYHEMLKRKMRIEKRRNHRRKSHNKDDRVETNPLQKDDQVENDDQDQHLNPHRFCKHEWSRVKKQMMNLTTLDFDARCLRVELRIKCGT